MIILDLYDRRFGGTPWLRERSWHAAKPATILSQGDAISMFNVELDPAAMYRTARRNIGSALARGR